MKRLSTTDFDALVARFEQEVAADRGVDSLESVRRLYPKILQLREQGVPLKQVLELLSERGLILASSTLRKYLKQIAKERRRGTRAPAPPRQAASTHTPQLAAASAPATPAARAPKVLSLASKAPQPPDANKNDVAAAPPSTGHFIPPPDSERI